MPECQQDQEVHLERGQRADRREAQLRAERVDEAEGEEAVAATVRGQSPLDVSDALVHVAEDERGCVADLEPGDPFLQRVHADGVVVHDVRGAK